MTHICVSNLTITGSDNGLSPGRRQAIIWTNTGLLLIGPLGTNFNEMLIEIHTFSFKKMPLKTSSAKRRPFCLGLNVLMRCGRPICQLDLPQQTALVCKELSCRGRKFVVSMGKWLGYWQYDYAATMYLNFDSDFTEMSEVWQLRFSSGISLSLDRSHGMKTKLTYAYLYIYSSRWRLNGYDGVSNHQPCDCLLNRLFRRRSKKTSTLHVTGFCAGEFTGDCMVNSSHKRPVKRKMFPFDDVIICKE